MCPSSTYAELRWDTLHCGILETRVGKALCNRWGFSSTISHVLLVFTRGNGWASWCGVDQGLEEKRLKTGFAAGGQKFCVMDFPKLLWVGILHFWLALFRELQALSSSMGEPLDPPPWPTVLKCPLLQSFTALFFYILKCSLLGKKKTTLFFGLVLNSNSSVKHNSIPNEAGQLFPKYIPVYILYTS